MDRVYIWTMVSAEKLALYAVVFFVVRDSPSTLSACRPKGVSDSEGLYLGVWGMEARHQKGNGIN